MDAGFLDTRLTHAVNGRFSAVRGLRPTQGWRCCDDEGAVGDEARRSGWREPKASRSDARFPDRNSREERQEGRVRQDPGPRHLPTSQDEGPHGTEPSDRRADQDSRAQEGRLLGRQDLQGVRARKGQVAFAETATTRPRDHPRAARPSQAGASRGYPAHTEGVRMRWQATFLAAAVVTVCGCATVVHGPYQEVTIDSDPP